jgi:SAM-dependent methyltransferase
MVGPSGISKSIQVLRKFIPVRLKVGLAHLWIFISDAVVRRSELLPFRTWEFMWSNPDLSAKLLSHEHGKLFYLRPKPKPAEWFDSSGLPIPPAELRYGNTVERYLSSGQKHVGKMLQLLQETGFAVQTPERILEFGCAAGRMLRWLYPWADQCELWGIDISAPHIAWCQDYLSPPFHFATTTTFPHLPFEDRYFDLIFCGSVFTHITELADAWLLELRRILRSGGRLYITVHDAHTVALLLHNAHYQEANLRKTLIDLQQATGLKYENFGMLALRQSPGGEQVFYESSYLSERWGRLFNVLSITPEAYGYQTAVVLAKP